MIHIDEDDPTEDDVPAIPFRKVDVKHNVNPETDYEILSEELGRGCFGTVYLCRERATGSELAAKFVKCARKEERINMEREIDIMRCLHHIRIIQLYDAYDDGKTFCVVLELILGGELFERVIDDEFVLTEKACTAFMRQIVSGVGYIHSQNIIHLDLKPENILCLSKTGNRIKIIDFGMARKYDPKKKLQVKSAKHMKALCAIVAFLYERNINPDPILDEIEIEEQQSSYKNVLFGTPEFTAPEVVNFDEITFYTDMWSLGVICYLLLSGFSPFVGDTDLATMTNVTVGKYDFSDEAFVHISEEAKDFVRSLLVLDRKKRLSAAEALLHPWLQTKAQDTELGRTKKKLKRYVIKKRWIKAVNTIVALQRMGAKIDFDLI